jgi:GNAT superfamily N-acetyltransferase
MQHRPFQSNDQAEVRAMIHELHLEGPEGLSSDEKIDRTFEQLNKHPDQGCIRIIMMDGKTVGYSILINFWSNEYGGIILDIDELFIKKEFRGKGLATGFIENLKATRFKDCVALSLGTYPGNEKARALYTRLGFKSPEIMPMINVF